MSSNQENVEYFRNFCSDLMDYDLEFIDYLIGEVNDDARDIEDLSEEDIGKIEQVFSEAMRFDFELCLAHKELKGTWHDYDENQMEAIENSVRTELENDGWEFWSTKNFGGHEFAYKI